MNIPDHISENIETIFWVKILKFFDADPGSGIFLTLDPGPWLIKIVSGIWDKHPEYATLNWIIGQILRAQGGFRIFFSRSKAAFNYRNDLVHTVATI
jgi:hypothetical protein